MDAILQDIQVLDLTQGLPGAYCTMHLGDLGAKVTRVLLNQEAETLSPALSHILHRNKSVLALDLSNETDRATLLELCAKTDMLVESFQPGQAEALGLEYTTLRQTNPGLLYASLTTFGQTGPMKDLPSDPLLASTLSGMADRTGRRGQPPMLSGVEFGGAYSGAALFSGLSMALFHRLMTGEGCQLEVSTLDCMFYMLELFVMNQAIDGAIAPKNGNQDSEVAPLGIFDAKDGYIALAISSEGQWKKFCGLVGAEALMDHPSFATNELRIQNLEQLLVELGQITAQWNKAELVNLLCGNKLAAGEVKSMTEIATDPQALATEMILHTTDTQGQPCYQLGCPMKFSLTPAKPLAQ